MKIDVYFSGWCNTGPEANVFDSAVRISL